jgi:putative transposase
MKKTRFTETQIVGILQEYEKGKKVLDLCREYDVSQATIFNWKKKYGGLEVSELRRIKEVEEENIRLKQMYADLSLDHQILKEVFRKNGLSSVIKKS